MTRDEYFAAWSHVHSGIDPRSSVFIKGYLNCLWPLIGLLSRARITPNTVTIVGGSVSSLAAIGAAVLQPTLFPLIAMVGLLLDAVDGGLAVATQRTSALGSVLDSVFDRVHELSIWVGLYLLVGQDFSLMLMTTALTFAMEYARARSQSLHRVVPIRVTVWERPTRVIVPVAMSLLWIWQTTPMFDVMTWVELGWLAQLTLACVALVQTLRLVRTSLHDTDS